MTWRALLVDFLAAYRITRLVTRDDFPPVLALRERIVEDAYTRAVGRGGKLVQAAELDKAKPWTSYAERDDSPPPLAQLVTCRWCSGAWIALGVVAARRLAPRLWSPAADVWALAAGAALIARLET